MGYGKDLVKDFIGDDSDDDYDLISSDDNEENENELASLDDFSGEFALDQLNLLPDDF